MNVLPTSKSPWRTPKVGRPESIALEPKAKAAPMETSWWTPYATPETPFDAFRAAAAARDAAMCKTSPEWRSVRVRPVVRSAEE